MLLWAPRPEWMARAACRGLDTDMFFPRRGGDPEPAKRVCATCPVAEDCLDWALETGQRGGIFGGLSERARRQVKRRRLVVNA